MKAATIQDAVSRFGASTKAKLSNPSVDGSPEDQLRGPFEALLADIALLLLLPKGSVVPVGESVLSAIRTRPDYAITVGGPLAGFVEIKAPGKGADPRKFKGSHDKEQWARLRSLPNLIYTDGNQFSLWQEGELTGHIVKLDGDVESSGNKLAGGEGLMGLFESFLKWDPSPPVSAPELARVSARLCRLLRDEVLEQLDEKSSALTHLAAGWRRLLFPDASDARFADGYAQAVTFGLLMARAKDISITHGLHQVSEQLGKTNSLIGAALHLLTDDAATRTALKTSLGTLERVLEVVDWQKITRGKPDAWLYFYEDFLQVYDNTLRKLTGSYYTPAQVVESMVRLVDETLRRPGFDLQSGLASSSVTAADPATGTGTYILGILRRIAKIVAADQGPGAVKGAVHASLNRLIAFEMQLGPFAVAQLRIIAEVFTLTGEIPTSGPRMFVTDTLGHPDDEEGWVFPTLAPIAEQRRAANKIKREEPITVVIGNPPYKEKAMGRGGWIEGLNEKAEKTAPLAAWMPLAAWKAGAHSKHLRNLYIYFWRWATWKVFDQPGPQTAGIVCYITVAGFLSGPGFQGMRSYLRRTCTDVWVIDCSPDGYQPEAATRIFQGVQQSVCIVLASRVVGGVPENSSAAVRWRALPLGSRQTKFDALATLTLSDDGWVDCPTDSRAPFLPAASDMWAEYLSLEDFFVYGGSGVMSGRTWVIAPDSNSLQKRWDTLVAAPDAAKETLFHPHLNKKVLGDRHVNRVISNSLSGYAVSAKSVAQETGTSVAPIRYGFRSFDRQWIIPDIRLINRPNPQLWAMRFPGQVFLTAFTAESPSGGPAVTVTGLVPDLHHYKGSFGGRSFALWRDAALTQPNLRPPLIAALSSRYGFTIEAPDLFAYIVALTAHPAYIARFAKNLATPGLRIPMTADGALFLKVADIGRRVVWLHSYGERMVDAKHGRPAGAPRMPSGSRPSMTGAIPSTAEGMPDVMEYDPAKKRLIIGTGFIDNVSEAVWNYAVSGKQILPQWFSYRRKSREKPAMGDKRPPSPLDAIQPPTWLAEYTTDLMDMLNVLGLLVDLEPAQKSILDQVCSQPLISVKELQRDGLPMAHMVSVASSKIADEAQTDLFGDAM